jgi:predicted secreted protein
MPESDPARTAWRTRPTPTASLIDQLADRRSKRDVFLCHCLLNEDVRYLGGATRAGVVQEVLDRYTRDGIGIYQIPCPEQRAWAGVLKTRMTRLYEVRLLRWRPAGRAVVTAARWWTRLTYRRLACRVAADINDYTDSGVEVVEIVGVGASPSCGVSITLDLNQAICNMARCDPSTLDRSTVNDRVAASVVDGNGMFIAALQRQLARRGLTVRFSEHDLLRELPDETTSKSLVHRRAQEARCAG